MKTRFSVSFHVLFAAVPVLLSAVAGAATLDDSLFSGDHVLSVGAVRQSVDARLAATNPDFRPVGLTLRDLGVSNRDYSYYVDYRFRFRPRWAVFASAYSFGSSGGRNSTRDFNYDGAFVYAHLKGSYRVTDKPGISLGYQVTDIDLTEARRFSDLSFDLQLDGPTLAISYRS